MKKHEGQNGETGRRELRNRKDRWRNMKDRMEKQEGQNGETWSLEWRNMEDRMKKHEGLNEET